MSKKSKYSRVLAFLKEHDMDSYLVRKRLKEARDADGEKEDTGWRTTENGKHYHINSEGEVDKGPKAMVGGNVNKPETWSSNNPKGFMANRSKGMKIEEPKKTSKMKPYNRVEAKKEFEKLPINSVVTVSEKSWYGEGRTEKKYKKVRIGPNAYWKEERSDGKGETYYNVPIMGFSGTEYSVEKGKPSKDVQKAIKQLTEAPVGSTIAFNEGIPGEKVVYTKREDGSWAEKGSPVGYRPEDYEEFIGTTSPESFNAIKPPKGNAKASNGERYVENVLPKERRDELTSAYSKAYQNQLSAGSEKKMEELEKEAKAAGLMFKMTNETAYGQPNALVSPKFELVPYEQGKVSASEKTSKEVERGMENAPSSIESSMKTKKYNSLDDLKKEEEGTLLNVGGIGGAYFTKDGNHWYTDGSDPMGIEKGEYSGGKLLDLIDDWGGGEADVLTPKHGMKEIFGEKPTGGQYDNMDEETYYYIQMNEIKMDAEEAYEKMKRLRGKIDDGYFSIEDMAEYNEAVENYQLMDNKKYNAQRELDKWEEEQSNMAQNGQPYGDEPFDKAARETRLKEIESEQAKLEKELRKQEEIYMGMEDKDEQNKYWEEHAIPLQSKLMDLEDEKRAIKSKEEEEPISSIPGIGMSSIGKNQPDPFEQRGQSHGTGTPEHIDSYEATERMSEAPDGTKVFLNNGAWKTVATKKNGKWETESWDARYNKEDTQVESDTLESDEFDTYVDRDTDFEMEYPKSGESNSAPISDIPDEEYIPKDLEIPYDEPGLWEYK